ncbi:MAG: DUF5659 domain-containing protein [Candidatus Levyibacteriota bacterium]
MTNSTPEGDTYFSTSDLTLATALSLWYPIEKIDKKNPRKAQFVFTRSPQLESLISSFWRGELKVDPKEYAAQQKNIKTRLYDDFETDVRFGGTK